MINEAAPITAPTNAPAVRNHIGVEINPNPIQSAAPGINERVTNRTRFARDKLLIDAVTMDIKMDEHHIEQAVTNIKAYSMMNPPLWIAAR